MIAFATFGHGPQGVPSARDRVVAIDVVPLEEASPTESTPSIPAAARIVSPSHTHSYPVLLDHNARPHDPSLVHLPLVSSHDVARSTTLDAPAATAARFSMRVGTNDDQISNGPNLQGASGDGPAVDLNGAPFPEASVSVPARLLGSSSPAYPAGARLAEIEADVALEIVVANDGHVLDARVLRRAGYGFDEEALRSVRGARFSPALRDGRAVAVRMRWTVSFRLR
jgi:TonB family protein